MSPTVVNRKPNLVILHAHDMGRYNAAYGHALPTPNIAAFARESFLFRDAHCAAPTCSPSRAAMLTGRTAHEVGLLGLTHRGWHLEDNNLHLAAWLGRHGYETALAGIQHELLNEDDGPYSVRIRSENRSNSTRDLAVANAAAAWLGEPRETPFFLWTGLFLPHVPFLKADPAEFPEGQMQPPACLPDTAGTRADWADYATSVRETDRCFGIILDALHASGHAENTLVILTTDHGVPLPKMKCSLTGHGTGVTLIIRTPNGEAPARGASDALVSHLDLFPTVCELLDLPVPDGLHGASLGPLMRGETDAVREDTFAEVTYHASYEPKRSVRTKRWNYIRSFDDDRRRPLANTDDTRSKRFLMAEGWALVPTEREALYDLINDPQESHNVVDDPAFAASLSEMRDRLAAWMEKTDDPILKGLIPAPKGAKSNPRQAVHPWEEPV